MRIPTHPLADWWRRADGFDGVRTSSGMPVIMHTIGNRLANEKREREVFDRHDMAECVAQAAFGWLSRLLPSW